MCLSDCTARPCDEKYRLSRCEFHLGGPTVRGATSACLSTIIALVGVLGSAGCRDNTSPPPPRVPVPVPASEAPIVRRDDGMKPLPPPPNYDNQVPPPPFDDAPLVVQQPP